MPWLTRGSVHCARYTFRVFMHNEFDPINHFDEGTRFVDGQAVLAFYDMENVNVARDLGVLVGYAVFFQILFAMILQKYHTGLR